MELKKEDSRRNPTSRFSYWTILIYGLMIAGTIAAFLLIRSYGNVLSSPTALNSPSLPSPADPTPNVLLHVLLALAAVIIMGQLLAKIFAYVSQPPVIGEVVAGILLGPSLLGTTTSSQILPPETVPMLSVVAQLGIILYMFIIGLELNADLLRERLHSTVAISHMSILVPFLSGALLSLLLYPWLSSDNVPFTSFALFMGVAFSITAFPVLARILTDLGLAQTELGVMSLGCAAISDVVGWWLLALVSGIATARITEGFWVGAGSLVYITIMFLFVRPILKRLVVLTDPKGSERNMTSMFLVILLLSAVTSEAVGIHAAFGAFLLGAIIPHDNPMARHLTQQLGAVVTILFLPAFFALTGMRTRLDLVSGLDMWLISGLIILVATASKFGGSMAAARLTGSNWRDSLAIGTLMNTRGLMELVVLNIGLELHVISPTLFSMMVLMALISTMATSPVLRLLMRRPDSFF